MRFKKILLVFAFVCVAFSVSADVKVASFEEDASDGSNVCSDSVWVEDDNCFSYDSSTAAEGSYSAHLQDTSNNAGKALMHWEVFDTDSKVDKLSAWYRETSSSHGHAVTIKDENGNRIAGFYTNNPGFGIYDADGFHGGQISGDLCESSSYSTWYQVNMTFDWSANTFSFERSDGCSGSGYNLGEQSGFSSVYVENADDENWENGNVVGWIDDVSLYSESIGPSICDSRGLDNECISNQSHSIGGQSFNISSVFEARSNAVFEALDGEAYLNVSNRSTISGFWRGSFNIQAERPRIVSGAVFRPENGNIVIGD